MAYRILYFHKSHPGNIAFTADAYRLFCVFNAGFSNPTCKANVGWTLHPKPPVILTGPIFFVAKIYSPEYRPVPMKSFRPMASAGKVSLSLTNCQRTSKLRSQLPCPSASSPFTPCPAYRKLALTFEFLRISIMPRVPYILYVGLVSADRAEVKQNVENQKCAIFQAKNIQMRSKSKSQSQ